MKHRFTFFRSLINEGIRAMSRNRLRSGLSILGIAVGIGAIVCVVAIGNAASDQVQQQFLNLGDNMIWIEAGGRNVNGIRTGTGTTKTLIATDRDAIVKSVPQVKSCSPQVDGHIQVINGNQNWSTTFRGESPEYFEIRRWQIASGGVFTETDVNRAANLCVLGHTVQTALFGTDDPLGKMIRVGGLPCQVIGTIVPKGLSGEGRDQDDFFVLPYTTAQRKISGATWLDDIMCSAVSAEAIAPATDEITRLLRDRHRLRSDQPDDFNIRHPEAQIQAQLDAAQVFSTLLVSIASVSLLVGGIGIMNVMLVSVTERTREIGVRLAVGATEGEVRVQFLSEAIALSLAGGAAGVLVGIVAMKGVGAAMNWTLNLSVGALLLGAAFSAAVGVVFGYYPARRASSLDPIEALRYE